MYVNCQGKLDIIGLVSVDTCSEDSFNQRLQLRVRQVDGKPRQLKIQTTQMKDNTREPISAYYSLMTDLFTENTLHTQKLTQENLSPHITA